MVDNILSMLNSLVLLLLVLVVIKDHHTDA